MKKAVLFGFSVFMTTFFLRNFSPVKDIRAAKPSIFSAVKWRRATEIFILMSGIIRWKWNI